jgi:hypothetical protein
MTGTTKQLLISKSHGDSNRCTPYRGKPDQHTTRFPCSVRVWSRTIRISCGPPISTFCETPIDLNGSHCSWEKGLPSQSTTRRLTDSWVHTQYVQYLLAGGNPSVLNWHRQVLQLWRCRLAIYHSSTFPTTCLHFPPKDPARSPV